jgi:pre-rRNA-processing protein IPI1
MEKLAERVSDSDSGVRASLRDLLGQTLLPGLVGSALAPFIPLLMAHVGSAMTHIAPDIRCGLRKSVSPFLSL